MKNLPARREDADPSLTLYGGWVELLGLSCLLALTFTLGVYVYLSYFSRYLADDYCLANNLQSTGFLELQVRQYVRWSGRFSSYFLRSVATMVGPRALTWVTGLAVISWVTALAWALSKLVPGSPAGRARWTPILLSALLIVATMDNAPNISQSLYWLAGVLTYTVALVLLTAQVGFLLNRRSSQQPRHVTLPALLLSAGIGFAVAGFSETSTALQIALLALAVLASLGIRSQADGIAPRSLLVASLAGAVLGFLVMALASGNAARQATFPSRTALDLLPALGASFKYTFHHAGRFLTRSPFTTAFLFLIAMLFGYVSPAQRPATAGDSRTRERRWATLLMLAGIAPFCLTLASNSILALVASRQGFVREPTSGGWQLALFAISTAVILVGLVWRAGILSTRAVSVLALISVVSFALITASIIPSAYARSAAPPARAQIVATYIVVCFVGIAGYVIGGELRAAVLRGRLPFPSKTAVVLVSAAVLLLLALGPIRSAGRLISRSAEARAYALRWDMRDQAIRSARLEGVMDVKVPVLGRTGGLQDIEPPPGNWVNECMAWYYDVNSVTALE